MIRNYVKSIRGALALAGGEPPQSMAGILLGLYAFSAVWIVVWWLAGPTGKRAHHFFVEGGPLDWLSTVYLATAALLAWLAWSGGRKDAPGAWFWLASAAGLVFLCLDERFQFHEHVLSDWPEEVFGGHPLGLRNWNDLIVIIYGLLALGLFGLALPAVLRYRGVRRLLVAGFVLYAGHTVLDAADELFNSAPLKEAAEEACKLLSGATLVLAYLQATLCRTAQPDGPSPSHAGSRRAISWGQVVVFYAFSLFMIWFLLTGDEAWHKTMTHRWGRPAYWLTSVYLAVAALFAWFTASPLRSRMKGARWFWYATAGWLVLLAIDVSTIACRFRFRHRLVRDRLPEFLKDGDAVLENLLNPSALIALAVLVAWIAAAWPGLRRHRMSWLLFVAAVGFWLVAASLSPWFEDPEKTLVVQVPFVLACASLVLAAVSRFASRLSRSVG